MQNQTDRKAIQIDKQVLNIKDSDKAQGRGGFVNNQFFQISQTYQNQFSTNNRNFGGKKYLNQSQQTIAGPSSQLRLLTGPNSEKESDSSNRNPLTNKPNPPFTHGQPARFGNRGKDSVQAFHGSTSAQKEDNIGSQNDSHGADHFEKDTDPEYEFFDENPDEVFQKHDVHLLQTDDPEKAKFRNEAINVNFVFKTNLRFFVRCNNCNKSFESRNQLFKHLDLTSFDCSDSFSSFENSFFASQKTQLDKNLVFTTVKIFKTSVSSKFSIITSKMVFTLFHEQNYVFREFQYAICELRVGDQAHEICINNGNPVNLINRKFLFKIEPEAKFARMASLLPIKKIGGKIVESNEMIHIKFIFENYTLLSFYKKNSIKACFETELHVIDELSINLVFENDVLVFQEIFFNMIIQKFRIGFCKEIIISFSVKTKTANPVHKNIKNKTNAVVSFKFIIIISVIYFFFLFTH